MPQRLLVSKQKPIFAITMKLFVIIGLLCLLVGCRPPKGEVSGAAPKASDTLVAIDSLMWSRPDSAFALLQEHFDPEQPYAQLLLA